MLCVLAAPRTGSSLLCGTLAEDPAFRNKSELFHPRWVGRLDDRELASLVARAGSADALVGWRAAHPGAVLDLLLDADPRGTLVIKVFPGHVRHRILRREVLARPDTAFAVLSRRPIDAFISATKARITATYNRVDTTTLRPHLDAREFARWARGIYTWYRWIDLACAAAGIDPVRISYDVDLAPDPAAAAAGLARRLGLDFRPAQTDTDGLFRQDRAADFRDRVTDWDAFAAAVDPPLLAWALADPPTGPRTASDDPPP